MAETFSSEGRRTIGKLTVIYVFVAMFWALFDQTASRWVFQAKRMNREVFGIEILPEQMQSLNPLLVMIFIPVFTYGLYPLLNKFFELTPLRKMALRSAKPILGLARIYQEIKRDPRLASSDSLEGHRVLLTRPGGRSAALIGRLEALGAQVAARPTIALVPPSDPRPARHAVKRLRDYEWLVFSSPSAVRFFRECAEAAGVGPPIATLPPSRARAVSPVEVILL